MLSPIYPLQAKSIRFHQTLVLVGLFAGYSGYYICRSNLSVAAPLILQEFGNQGINKEVLGQIASLGVVFYSLGKFINGIVGDFIGGKKVFLIGMAGAILFNFLFGLGSGPTLFFGAWAANRLIQSMGWGGLVKLACNWFNYKTYGKVMAFLSLSYLAGDVIAKLILGQMLNLNFSWRELFFASAGILGVVLMAEYFLLKEKPEDIGYPSPEGNPENLFSTTENEKPTRIFELLKPYFTSPSFLLLLLMSFGMTALREAFSFWIPTYLYESASLSKANASFFSALYSMSGMVSILLAGYMSDTLLQGKRGVLIFFANIPMVLLLLAMTLPVTNTVVPVLLVSGMGFFLLGPYSFLAGAMSCDLGGKKGVATAAGLVDGIGYIGGTLALWLTGRLSQNHGWDAAFFSLAMVSVFTAFFALAYYLVTERKTSGVKKIQVFQNG